MTNIRPASRTWGKPLCTAVMVGTTLLAPQLLGGVTPATNLMVLVLAVACTSATSLWAMSSRRQLGRMPISAVAALIATFWTFAQLLPLPCSWIAKAFQDRFDLLSTIARLADYPDLRCSISAAPGSTRNALAMASAIFGLICSAAVLARSGQRRALTIGIALSSVLMALVALGHHAFNAAEVFGLYTPKLARPGLLLAPLLNGNHLAGHMVLGFPLCLRFALQRGRLDLKICWMVASALVFLCCCFTLSRGGLVALVFGGGSYLWFQRLERTDAPWSIAHGILAAILVAAAAGVAYLGVEIIATAFVNEGASPDKVQLALTFLNVATDHSLVGIGRGSLADLSPSVTTWVSWPKYAENLVAQWSVEWGFVVTAVLLVLFTASLVKGWPTKVENKALPCGLIALTLHNLVDFSFEVPGLAVVAAIGLGIHSANERGRLRWQPPLSPAVAVSAAVAVFSLVLAVPVLTSASRPAVLGELQKAAEESSAEYGPILQTAIRYHPLDPPLLLTIARHALEAGQKDAAAWLNVALRVAPHWPTSHLLAAHYLERMGRPQQAAIELSLVADIDLNSWRPAACDLAARSPRADTVMSALATGPNRKTSIEVIYPCLGSTFVEAGKLGSALLEEKTSPLIARALLVWSAARAGDGERAIAQARIARNESPHSPAAYALLLEMLNRFGRTIEALRVYEAAPQAIQQDQQVLRVAAAAAAAQKDTPTLARLVEELLARYGTSTSLRAGLDLYGSELFLRAGEPVRAMTCARRAYDSTASPESAAMLHDAAVQAGREPLALRMATELCHLRYQGGRFCRPGTTGSGQ